MRLFVDTSALVKLYYPEPGSQRVEEKILKYRYILISELSVVEFASALMKKKRQGEINEEDRALIWESFQRDLGANNVTVISLESEEYVVASKLISDHGGRGLRTLDSLQLAAATKIEHVDILTEGAVLSEIAAEMELRVIA